MPVSRIQIIKPGSLTIDAFEYPSPSLIAMKYLCDNGGNSRVTYIESDAKILVDTGFEFEMDLGSDNIARNKKLLVRSLKDPAITPKDIDILFITHWYADHTQDNASLLLSTNAMRYKQRSQSGGRIDLCRREQG